MEDKNDKVDDVELDDVTPEKPKKKGLRGFIAGDPTVELSDWD